MAPIQDGPFEEPDYISKCQVNAGYLWAKGFSYAVRKAFLKMHSAIFFSD